MKINFGITAAGDDSGQENRHGNDRFAELHDAGLRNHRVHGIRHSSCLLDPAYRLRPHASPASEDSDENPAGSRSSLIIPAAQKQVFRSASAIADDICTMFSRVFSTHIRLFHTHLHNRPYRCGRVRVYRINAAAVVAFAGFVGASASLA